MTLIAGPLPCIACHRPVTVDRIGSCVRMLEGHLRHNCPGIRPAPPIAPPKLCGAWMPNVQEQCARAAGHSMSGGHRRRTVMDDDALARRGRRAA